MTLVRLDGTVVEQRTNIFNLWAPVSESTYNSPYVWALFYAIEMVLCILNVFIWLCFDGYAITMCYVLNGRFLAMADEYEALGRRCTSGSHPIP